MQDQPVSRGVQPPFSADPMPEPTPPTVRRPRRASPSTPLSSLDSMPYAVQSMTLPVPPEFDEQPSAQVRALRGGQIAIATAIITSSFIVSRILGIARTSFFAYVIGSGNDANAYTYAFLVPNTIYNIVAGGALSSAFIPVFADYLIERRDKKNAWYVASAALNIATLLLIFFCVLGIIFSPQLAHLYAPGAFSIPDQANQIILLSRVMLIQPVILGISVITTSILQTRQRFLLPAIGSVLYNVGLLGGIAATLVDQHTHIFGGNLGILGPTWGVVVAAALQLIIQIPGVIASKVKYTFTFDFFHPGVRKVFILMVPRLINAIALYASTFVVGALLSLLGGSTDNNIFYGYQNAFQLILLPIGIFGMAVSQAAFPTLATLVATGEWGRMRSTVLGTLRIVLYLAIPSSLGLMILAEPITRLIFAHGKFGIGDTPNIYIPLIFFSIGIPGLALIEILVRAYYALQDSRTAVEVGIVELFFFLGLAVLLIQPMGAGGMALAQSIGSTGEAIVLLILLRPRLGWFKLRPLVNFIAGVIAASLVATLAALLTYTLMVVVVPNDGIGVLGTLILGGQLIIAGGVGAVIYYLGAKFLGIEDTLPIDRIARRVGVKLKLVRS